MTRNMYWISALCFVLMILIVLIKERRRHGHRSKMKNAFFMMNYFALFNCAQDAFWGLCFSRVIENDTIFFLSTSVAHVSYVASLFFWLYFILEYMKCREPYRTVLLGLDGLLIIAETGLVVANVFTPLLFTIENGEYVPQAFRPLTFAMQYVVYLTAGAFTLIKIMLDRIKHKEFNLRHWAVFCASALPIAFGAVQYMYPDAPMYSMVMLLSCFVLYIYVVSLDREELQQSKVLFLQNMSHEIRTSLNSVYGFAQLLSLPDGTWTAHEREAYAAHIHNSYNMLDMLLNDLMVSTRYDTHKYSVKISTVDVAKACTEAVEAVDVCKPASVAVCVSAEVPEGFTIQSDGRRIRQILQNLLTNASQFVTKGRILLHVCVKDEKLEFSVADDSPNSQGQAEDRELMEKRHEHMSGAGLRLRISQKMAKLLGGRVYRDVEYTGGTRHVFALDINS